MIQLIWNFLAYLGVGTVSDTSEHKHILLVNSLAIFLSLVQFLLLFITLFLPYSPFYYSISLAYPFFILFALVLNAKGKVNLARNYLVFLSFIYITYFLILNGNQAKTHFYYLLIALASFFTHPYEKRKTSYFIIIFVLVLFIGFEFFLPYIKPLVPLPKEYLIFQTSTNNISFALMLTGFSFYIYSIFKKAELSIILEHQKSKKLLENILPLAVIEKLRENPDSIAESFDECTVLFSDIVGFTEISRKLPAQELVSFLNEIFSIFDDLAEKYGLEKIKTIGDAYMVAGGLPEKQPFHAERVADFALEMIAAVQIFREKTSFPLQLRIGIHSGNAIAGVIGKKKFIYDLWGESVNTASRMESHGIPGQIQVSESTYIRLKDKFTFMERGILEVKGMGKVKSYFLMQKV